MYFYKQTFYLTTDSELHF